MESSTLSHMKKEAGYKKILILSGIHGDEPSGPRAISAFLKKQRASDKSFAIVALPILNRWGYAYNSRYNKDGIDLNRCFFDKPRKNEPRECARIRVFIKSIKIPHDLLISLHEDIDQKCFYLYDSGNGKGSPLIKTVFTTVKNAGIKLYTGTDDSTLSSRIIKNGYLQVSLNDPSPTLEEFLSRNKKVKRVLTFEIPGKLPLKQKVGLALILFETVLKAMK